MLSLKFILQAKHKHLNLIVCTSQILYALKSLLRFYLLCFKTFEDNYIKQYKLVVYIIKVIALV